MSVNVMNFLENVIDVPYFDRSVNGRCNNRVPGSYCQRYNVSNSSKMGIKIFDKLKKGTNQAFSGVLSMTQNFRPYFYML